MAKPTRRRTITDEEIALIKAMLSKGTTNAQVHFHFNRADRLISSGRIAQIKRGKYGASVPEASLSELAAFLAQWEIRQTAASEVGPRLPTDRNVLLAMFTGSAGVWTMRLGETDEVECKQSFCLFPDQHSGDLIKAIAGLANNKGGYIFFGIVDRIFIVDGLSDSKFIDTDPSLINRSLAAALDPVPKVTKASIKFGDKTIGVLHVDKHGHAPVVALKNIAGNVKEGTIYYRYVGETRPIKPGELRQIIAHREQRAVAEFTRRMARVARGMEATIDLQSGEVRGKSGRFVIDKDLLSKIQFIREGDFSELKGAPALRLIGEVEPASSAERERVRVIRENVTPDAVIRSFLTDEAVPDPMQYIHFQAHAQRKWLPIWFYVKQTSIDVDTIVDDLRRQVATHPASRDAVVHRLRRTASAYQAHPGKPATLRVTFSRGELVLPTSEAEDMIFAYAVQGIQDGQVHLQALRPMLLACLDRAQRNDPKTGSRRSAIYRAACRLDELLYASPNHTV